jgi:hypothetical protein
MAMGNGLRARSWRLVAMALAILLALGMLPGPAPSSIASAQDDAIRQSDFDDLVEAAQEEDPIYGPEDGELVHDPELVTLSYADITAADFLATAVFTNPYAGNRDQFDYGLQFRIADGDDGVLYLRFIVVSTTDWAITNSDGDIVVQGVYEDLDISRRGENELMVYAEGDTVHLGINGDYVGSATVDNEEEGEIAVGTAFFGDSFQEDAASEFFEFTIWELAGSTDRGDDPLGRRDNPPATEDEPTATEEAEDEPTATEEANDEPTATEEDGDEPPATEDEPTATEEDADEPAPTEEPAEAEGTRYESPTYGYTFVYDETWEERTESSGEGVDLVEITNGPSSMQFYGYATDETPTECIDAIIANLEDNSSVESVEIALDEDDQEMRGDGDTQAFAVLNVSYTSSGSDSVDFGAYYACYQVEEGESILQVTHLALIEDYNDEIENRAAVLDTLEINGELVAENEIEPTPTEADVEPTATEAESTPADEEPTATEAAPTPTAADVTPTEALPEGAVAIFLPAISPAGTSAIGSLAPAGNRTEVTLLVLLGEPEAIYVVTVNTGICINPGPVEHVVGVTDVDGGLAATINATVEELSNGDYIMVIATADAPDEPVACGNLADLAE